jgi:H/ACA ribonucleoprotein complex subunit 3
MKHILKCAKCNKYTMKEICGCGSKTLVAKPLKYSPEDKFSSYRRKAKLNEYAGKGLI